MRHEPHEHLTAAQARRLVLGAQGFVGRGRTTPPARRTLLANIERVRVLQIDSFNVWERSHYMPLFSRLGPYDRARLDTLTFVSYESRPMPAPAHRVLGARGRVPPRR